MTHQHFLQKPHILKLHQKIKFWIFLNSGTRPGDISGTYSGSCTILNLIDTIVDMKSSKWAHRKENLTGRATCNHSCPYFVNGRELCNSAETSDNLSLLTKISLWMSNMVIQKFINVNVPEF